MTIRFFSFRAARRLPLLLAGSLLFGAACSESPTASKFVQTLSLATAGEEIMFNPQPDPPREIYHVVITDFDPYGSRWSATLRGTDEGAEWGVIIENRPADARGQTLHLNQRWTFITDGTSLPAVQVAGVLNLASGRLVLNGLAGDGRRVHVDGWTTTTGGINSIAAELMFNPQPDPPLEGR
jgi:hypothetical protein